MGCCSSSDHKMEMREVMQSWHNQQSRYALKGNKMHRREKTRNLCSDPHAISGTGLLLQDGVRIYARSNLIAILKFKKYGNGSGAASLHR